MIYNFPSHPISRRRFLGVGLRGLAAAFGAALLSPLERAMAAAPDVRFLRQLVAQDNRTGRTIMWQSNRGASAGVEWRRAGDIKSCRFPAAASPFSDDGEESFQHTAYLKDLPAGSQGEYRIIEKRGPATDWYPLRLDDGKSCKMVIMPDSQSSDGYITWHRIARGAAIRNRDADLWVNLGDLVDNGEDFQQWDDWFTSLEGITARLAFVPVLGNHETYDRNWAVRWPKAFLGYFAGLPENGSPHFAKTYFSFDYGPIHFIALNTQWEEMDPLQPGLFDEQCGWLKKDLQASRKPWNIVLMHKDIIDADNPPKNALADTGRRLMPIFDHLPIDVVLTGHNHTYRRRAHIRQFRRDPLGPLYICTGVAGNERYYDIPKSSYDDFIAPQPETNNYLVLEATPEKLSFCCFLGSGIPIDQFSLTKKKG